MNNRVVAMLAILAVWIGLGLWLCNKYFCNASTTSTNISQSSLAPAAVAPADNLWSYQDGNKFSDSSKDRFAFGLSGINELNNSNAELDDELGDITGYLKANSDRELTITGYYKDSENNESLFPSLGHARANVIKSKLVALGASAKQLMIGGALLPDAKFASESGINHGIDFSFANSSADARLTEIKNRLLGKPLTVYFQTNSKRITFSESQRKDFNDMLYYMENVAGSKLNIGGHTDSVGGRRANVALSKKRADFVANYLNTNAGVNTSLMDTEGFGPAKPVATNDTSEGKAKNRRVEIVLN